MKEEDVQRAIECAAKARSNAYAPYSVYSVGAAVLTEDGAVFAGCNVENASFGLSVCAERNAVSAMIMGGGSRIVAVAVATSEGATPCGACLQVLAEFASPNGVRVVCFDESGIIVMYMLDELAPHLFRANGRER